MLREAITKFTLGLFSVGVLIFVPAGSFSFAYGWLFMCLMFVPMFIAGLFMYVKAPELLQKRLNAKEKDVKQDSIIKLTGLMFIVGFFVAGLNFRYSWSNMPKAVILIASAIFLLSYIVYAEVLRENAYLSRTIEVQKGQTVIDTGLYGLIRHPMYTATIFLFLSIPLILNSFYSFLVFLAYPYLINKRLIEEEKYLKENLDGYENYMKKVKYRLFPFIY